LDSAADIAECQTACLYEYHIVENQLVGDSHVPLLMIVPRQIPHRPAENVWVSFKNVQYVPVINSLSDVIEINIRHDDGHPVSFDSGKVILTLYFKPTP